MIKQKLRQSDKYVKKEIFSIIRKYDSLFGDMKRVFFFPFVFFFSVPSREVKGADLL